MNIVIFSNPIRSGKTTRLQQWCAQKKNIAGILMPDINGKRNVVDIKTAATFEIECSDPENTSKVLVNIGRYYFYAEAFEKANSILLQASTQAREWLVIDEVGKLEIIEKGFYPAVKAIITTASCKNLLLVVREGLCEAVVSFFKINDYQLINDLDDLK